MFQKRERFGMAQRGAESGFWSGTPWRSLVVGCVLLGGVHLTSPMTSAQYGGVPPRQTGQYGNGQYTPPGQFPPLPPAPQPQAGQFPPLPTVPQMTHFPPVPIKALPKGDVIQIQAQDQPP